METADVSVLTCSIPTRHAMLAECVQSVAGQSVRPAAHLVGIDYQRIGTVANLNRLIDGARTKWLMILEDDDILYPRCLERLMETAESGTADMVYPWCRVVGRGDWNPNSHFDAARLAHENYIPATVLIQREVVLELGHYPRDYPSDWAMWRRLVASGKEIQCLPEVLWEYRFATTPEHRNASNGYGYDEL